MIGCSEQASDPGSTAIPTRQSGAESAAGTLHDAIQWHIGDVDSAFAAARATRRPVLLYWGADWCPPCSRLKATVFRRPDFVERTRMFVAVNLAADDPRAIYPDHLAAERSGIFLAYLGAHASSAEDDEGPPPLSGEEQTRVRARLLEILEDPVLVQENHRYMVYGAHWIYGMVADPADAEAEALADSWEAVLAGMREDPASSSDRIPPTTSCLRWRNGQSGWTFLAKP